MWLAKLHAFRGQILPGGMQRLEGITDPCIKDRSAQDGRKSDESQSAQI
jgi:hypothetical protein